MGNQKIWEPTVVVGASVVFLCVAGYLFAGPTNSKGKDGAEVIGDKVNAVVTATNNAFQDIKSAVTMRGGSATKRHKKHRRKSHKKR